MTCHQASRPPNQVIHNFAPYVSMIWLIRHKKTWKDHIVSHLFDPYTTYLILNAPMFQQVTMDTLVWQGEKNGRYSVCNAYRICSKSIWDTTLLNRYGNWNHIWKTKVLPKVKILVWMVCHDCFPTRVWLNVWGAIYPYECVMCSELAKIYHILCLLLFSRFKFDGHWTYAMLQNK